MTIELKKNAYIKKIDQLERLETDLLEKQTQVEEYIQQIEKSELRMMLRFYYIDDLPWYKVAMQMNQIFPQRKIKYTEDIVSNDIKDILINYKNVTQCHGKMC